jgi:5-methylcytosine-specific restriction enzyme subunit McrC
MFLSGYARDPTGWRDIVAAMEEEKEVFSAVASGFAAHASRAIESGVLPSYITVDESSPMIRGRLRVRDQIAVHAGLPLPAEIRYDDYSTDIPENRLLAAASTLLLRLPRIPARARLRRVRATLATISPPTTNEAPAETRINARYGPAMALASRILKSLSITTTSGELTSSTFVFDMNRVFEEFLETALIEALRPYGGRIERQLTDTISTATGKFLSGRTSRGGRERASRGLSTPSTNASSTRTFRTATRAKCSPTAALSA